MKKRSVVVVAEEILVTEGRPLHYKILTEMLLGSCQLTGKTPHESVRSLLGTDPRFKRVAEGVYALTAWKEYPAARFAKDIAYDILKAGGKPMRLQELGKQIFNERVFKTNATMVVRGVVRTDRRFYYDPKLDVVGLAKWRR